MEKLYPISTRGLFSDRGYIGIGTSLPASGFEFSSQNIGETQDDAKSFVLINPKTAKAGLQQYSPALIFGGQGWGTSTGVNSKSVKVKNYLVPVQGSALPTSYLTWQSSINEAANTEILRLTSSAQLSATTAFVGTIGGVPSSYLHLAAGTTVAGTAPLKFDSGTLNTTKVAGQHEYNGNHYLTNNVVRQGIGGTVASFYTDANNTGTSRTALYTYTVPANLLLTDGDALEFEFSLTINDATMTTATIELKLTNFLNSAVIPSASATGHIVVRGSIIKDGANDVRAQVTFSYAATPTGAGVVFASYINASSSLDTNADFILYATATGGTAGDNDITAKSGWIRFIPHANN